MALLERRWKIVVSALFALSLGLSACGDDEGGGGIDQKVNANIMVTPGQITLEQVPIGSELQRSVQIRNLGAGTLRISEMLLHESVGGEFDTNKEFFEAGDGWVDGEVQLEQNETHTLQFIYRPLDQRPDRGAIVIRSNDPLNAELKVPIVTQGLAPEIFSPPTVSWPRLSPVIPPEGAPAWQGGWKLTQVQNVGDAALAISNITVEGSDRFRFTIPARDGDTEAPSPETDTLNWPDKLEPGEKFTVRVWFKPVDDNPVTGKLVFESNDPRAPVYSVNLIGNSGAPCLAVSPNDGLSFGLASIGVVTQKSVTMQNCSANSDLKISDIRLAQDGGGVFEIKAETLPGGLPEEELVLSGGQMANFTVTFSPEESDSFEGELVIDSNDPANPQYKLAVTGRGTTNACPTAVATATVIGNPTSRPSDTIQTLPLSTIQFDGTRSSDPDGTIARYEWTLLSSPRDSTELIRPQGSAEPTLFLDMHGEYKVELKVYDDQNTVSCGTPAIITIFSHSEEDILIQLSWDTPGDNDRYDRSGSDIDLHYLHPSAAKWASAPYDCYYANKTPTSGWGQPGNLNDKPTLDIDDTDGWGPENISHSNLENVIYRVGVHYWSDHGYGPSYVTVRIFRSGIESFTIEDKFMSHHEFWDVARLDGRTLNATAIDIVYPDYPAL